MPPRFAYWTIIAGGLPTAFRAVERDELLPTFARLREKHPDAEMKWFARGKLWASPEAAREQSARDRERHAWPRKDDSRPPRDAHRPRDGQPPRGDRPPRAGQPRADQSFGRRGPDAPTDDGQGRGGPPGPPADAGKRGKAWRPGGEHRDPRQPFKDAKKARNLQNRQQRFERKSGQGRPPSRPDSTRPAPRGAGPTPRDDWKSRPSTDHRHGGKPPWDKSPRPPARDERKPWTPAPRESDGGNAWRPRPAKPHTKPYGTHEPPRADTWRPRPETRSAKDGAPRTTSWSSREDKPHARREAPRTDHARPWSKPSGQSRDQSRPPASGKRTFEPARFERKPGSKPADRPDRQPWREPRREPKREPWRSDQRSTEPPRPREPRINPPGPPERGRPIKRRRS